MLGRRILAALAVLAPTVIVGTATAAHADNPRYCYNDSSIAGNNWTHGNPNLGLPYRQGYAYVDLATDAACPIGADGEWHIIEVTTVTQEVKSPGAFPGTAPGTVDQEPDAAITAYPYWDGFAHADAGVTTETLDGDPNHVTTTSATTTCKPNTTDVLCVVANGASSWRDMIRYDGPWIFGTNVRARWADEATPSDTDSYVVDVTEVCIVPTSTSTTCDSETGALLFHH